MNLAITNIYKTCITNTVARLASVGIQEKEREPRVGKLSWHGNFDTGFERNYFVQNSVCGFFNFLEIATVLLVLMTYSL